MIWESWKDFFAMGGYALYVWGSMIVVFVCLAGECLQLRDRSAAIRAQLVRANGGAQSGSVK
jgi:heme exporter protein D